MIKFLMKMTAVFVRKWLVLSFTKVMFYEK